MRAFPPWLLVGLGVFLLLCLAWVALFPLLPTSSLVARSSDGKVIQLIRGHQTTVPFHKAWSSEGWRRVGWPGRLLPALGVLLCVLLGAGRWQRGAAAHAQSLPTATLSARRATLLGVILTLGGAVLFTLGRVAIPVLVTYGDSIALIRQIAAATWVFPAEPLTMHLFNGVSRLLTLSRGVPDGVLAGQITAYACGAAFLVSSWVLVLGRTRRTPDALILFAALTCTATATQFFGYIETTMLQTAALVAFLAAAARTLQATPGSGKRDAGLFVTHLCLGVVLCAHAGGVALLPCLVVFWVLLWRLQKHAVQPQARLLSLRNVAGALAAMALPWLSLVWWPFLRVGNLGNTAGGADTWRFVPWDVEAARQSSRYVYYSMLSGLHALDLLAALVAAAPLALPLCISALVLRRRGSEAPDAVGAAVHLVYLAAAAGCSAIVVLWDFDFGMWGDWNIATCYLVPLHVYAWTVLYDAVQRSCPGSATRWTLLVPGVILQGSLGLGLWLQFHPVAG